MSGVPYTRRLVALMAAYAMVLQAFLPLTALAAAGSTGPICMTAGDAAPPPLSDQNNCGCAAECGVCCALHALAAPPQVAVPAAPAVVTSIGTPLRLAFNLPSPRHRPQAPRPPPAH
jgi:hypothetical protein